VSLIGQYPACSAQQSCDIIFDQTRSERHILLRKIELNAAAARFGF
jgi:hypothetical protein